MSMAYIEHWPPCIGKTSESQLSFCDTQAFGS